MSQTTEYRAIDSRQSAHEYEVLVVGFGPVGAAIGNLLGGYGVHTLVIDKSTGIFMAPRAIALDNEALRILQLAGLPESAFGTVAIPKVLMHSPQVGQFACINTAGSINGHPKLVTFYQPELEQVLREKLKDHRCVDTQLGCELGTFEEQEDGVIATLRQLDGSSQRVRARYLVAADGASSKVRKHIGQDFHGQTYAEDWLIIDARRAGPPIEHVEFRCDPQRPAPHMPAPGGRERWEFMLRRGETREQMESDESIRALLAPWGEASGMEIERRAVYRFHARVAAAFSKGRIFLAGDAAHITPPFVGQGLAAGLRDAANLSWKLAWVLKGRAAPTILNSYDAERRPHACAMINLARLMGRLVMPANRTTSLLVHGLLRQLRRIPALRRYFDELGIKPKNRFASGLFVRGRAGSRLLRGDVLPQGWLRNNRGEIRLSDDALGPSMTLIGFGGDASKELSPAALTGFSAAGGRILRIDARGQGQAPRNGGDWWENLDDTFIPTAVSHGWAAIVRPDRTVLHDGPIEEATRLVRESLRLLGLPDPGPLTAGQVLTVAAH